MADRVYVYVDGFNLYYRALKGSNYKWLDIEAFAYNFLGNTQRIEKVRYFTAKVSGKFDSSSPIRQEKYLAALRSNDTTTIKEGTFITKETLMPKVNRNGRPGELVNVFKTEEKGSDVNLGAHLLNDAHLDKFDVALVLSQDSDLLEPMRLSRELGKAVGIVWLQPKTKSKSKKWTGPSRYHQEASTFIKYARNGHYKNSQFDVNIYNAAGKLIASRPQEWTP